MSITMIAATLLAATTAVKAPADKASAVEEEPPSGGYVRVGGEGCLALVDCCKADVNVISQSVDRISNSMMIHVKNQKGTWSLPTAAADLKAQKATAAVFVVKDKSLPMSLVAMESRWGVVNAEGLTVDQLAKEIVRVSVVVLGGATSKYEASYMRPVFSPADLDKAGSGFTIDTIMAVFPNLPDHGIKQFRTMTFRDACEEGIVLEPKDDVQRKIAAEYKKQK